MSSFVVRLRLRRLAHRLRAMSSQGRDGLFRNALAELDDPAVLRSFPRASLSRLGVHEGGRRSATYAQVWQTGADTTGTSTIGTTTIGISTTVDRTATIGTIVELRVVVSRLVELTIGGATMGTVVIGDHCSRFSFLPLLFMGPPMDLEVFPLFFYVKTETRILKPPASGSLLFGVGTLPAKCLVRPWIHVPRHFMVAFVHISFIFYVYGRSDFEVDAVPLSCGMEKCARSMLQLHDLPELSVTVPEVFLDLCPGCHGECSRTADRSSERKTLFNYFVRSRISEQHCCMEIILVAK